MAASPSGSRVKNVTITDIVINIIMLLLEV